MRPTPSRPYPWVVPDLFRWFAFLGAAAVGLTVAWWGASGTASTSRLVAWVDLGVGAVVVSGLANMRWLLRGRRAVAARKRDLLASCAVSGIEAMAHGVRRATDTRDRPRVAVPGATRYHHPGCAAVAGKTVEAAVLAEHERAGRQPCGLCAAADER